MAAVDDETNVLAKNSRELSVQRTSMGLPSTMYRFEVDVSDTDRGVYESFDLRIAKHPSETTPYMLTRLIACLLYTSPSPRD